MEGVYLKTQKPGHFTASDGREGDPLVGPPSGLPFIRRDVGEDEGDSEHVQRAPCGFPEGVGEGG